MDSCNKKSPCKMCQDCTDPQNVPLNKFAYVEDNTMNEIDAKSERILYLKERFTNVDAVEMNYYYNVQQYLLETDPNYQLIDVCSSTTEWIFDNAFNGKLGCCNYLWIVKNKETNKFYLRFMNRPNNEDPNILFHANYKFMDFCHQFDYEIPEDPKMVGLCERKIRVTMHFTKSKAELKFYLLAIVERKSSAQLIDDTKNGRFNPHLYKNLIILFFKNPLEKYRFFNILTGRRYIDFIERAQYWMKNDISLHWKEIMYLFGNREDFYGTQLLNCIPFSSLTFHSDTFIDHATHMSFAKAYEKLFIVAISKNQENVAAEFVYQWFIESETTFRTRKVDDKISITGYKDDLSVFEIFTTDEEAVLKFMIKIDKIINNYSTMLKDFDYHSDHYNSIKDMYKMLYKEATSDQTSLNQTQTKSTSECSKISISRIPTTIYKDQLPANAFEFNELLLGQGGEGSVILGKFGFIPVAIKKPDYVFQSHDIDTRKLVHPNLARILGRIQIDNLERLVMAYAGTANLDDFIKLFTRIELWWFLKYMSEIACGMDYLHSIGIIHRDLKPMNVIIYGSVSSFCAKICDFGLIASTKQLNEKVEAIGTTRYMAPEVIRQQGPLSSSVDIWSFGVILYEMITGKTPYGEYEEFQIRFQVARGLIKLDLSDIKLEILSENTKDKEVLDQIQERIKSLFIRCMDRDSTNRPNAKEALKCLKECYKKVMSDIALESQAFWGYPRSKSDMLMGEQKLIRDLKIQDLHRFFGNTDNHKYETKFDIICDFEIECLQEMTSYINNAVMDPHKLLETIKSLMNMPDMYDNFLNSYKNLDMGYYQTFHNTKIKEKEAIIRDKTQPYVIFKKMLEENGWNFNLANHENFLPLFLEFSQDLLKQRNQSKF